MIIVVVFLVFIDFVRGGFLCSFVVVDVGGIFVCLVLVEM